MHTRSKSVGRRRKTLLVLSGSLAALAVALTLPAGAAAYDQSIIPFQPGNPLVNGCAAGFEALQVSGFPLVYSAPSIIDDPANGGNGDGVVCGRPWTPAEQAARLPGAYVPVVFDFTDNTLTSSH